MYLINTETLELKHYIDAQNCPAYAILSHRWTDDELTYKDFINGRRKDSSGHKKVVDFCKAAKDKYYEWAWVDTCCIDGRSSAELQEAINSMFGYYSKAGECYVHLADVTASFSDDDFETQFLASQWFTRGWTLQELLAPDGLGFFSQTWKPLGVFGRFKYKGRWMPTITNDSPRELVSRATGIQGEYIAGRRSVFDASLACRMSWASARITTREEDLAYSLLGIFRVNMPLLYGEGKQNAFLRLQEEIMKGSDDHSLFAWSVQSDATHGNIPYRGLLAEHPSWFTNSQAISPSLPRRWADTDPYALTSRGVRIVLSLLHWTDDIYLANLDCEWQNRGYGPTIILRKVAPSKPLFRRVLCAVDPSLHGNSIPKVLKNWKTETVYIEQYGPVSWPTWLRRPSFLLLEPQSNKPYQVERVQRGDMIRCLRRSQTRPPYYDLGTTYDEAQLLSATTSIAQNDLNVSTVLLRHIATDERLIVTIAPLTTLNVGFSATLADSPSAQRVRHVRREELLPLNSQVDVPSALDGQVYHRVKVGVKLEDNATCVSYHTLELSVTYDLVFEKSAIQSGSDSAVQGNDQAQTLRLSRREPVVPGDGPGKRSWGTNPMEVAIATDIALAPAMIYW